MQNEYIISENNALAYRVAMDLASGTGYTPFFIYGKPGLGKTRLLQEIKNSIEKELNKSALYVTAERFGNDFVEVVQNKKTVSSFNKLYGSCDILLIDDFEFLKDKPAFQMRFFKEFDVLYLSLKNIVIASSLSPNELGFSERYNSRLKMGVVVELASPNYDARCEFVKKCLNFEGIDISEEALIYICQNITSNYRELEGAVNSVKARCKLGKDNKRISIDEVKDWLKDFALDDSIVIDAEKIVATICEYFNISSAEIIGKDRRKDLVLARQIACYLCRMMTDDMTLNDIAKVLNRDHSTIVHSINKLESDLKAENATPLKNTIDSIVEEIKNRR